MKSEDVFIPCKECMNCCLSTLENEPYYFCKEKPNVLYVTIKDMIKHCPYVIG